MISRLTILTLVLALCTTVAQAQTQTVQEVQLVQPTNGNSFAVRAGASTVQQTVTWPAVLPTTGQYLKVASVSGSNVTLEWGAGTGGGGGGTPLVAARTGALVLTALMQDALTFTAVADQTYRFSGRLLFNANNPAIIDAFVQWTLPAGATIDYVFVNEGTGVSGTSNNAGETTIPQTAVGQFVYIGGRVNMGGNAGNIVLRARRGGTALSLGIGSYLNFIP